MPNAKKREEKKTRILRGVKRSSCRVQRDAAFSFAIYLIRHWPALGSFYTGAFPLPPPHPRLMAKSILPEISFCGRQVWRGFMLCFSRVRLGGRMVGGVAKLLDLPCAWSAPCVGPANSLPHPVVACPTRQWRCGCRWIWAPAAARWTAAWTGPACSSNPVDPVAKLRGKCIWCWCPAGSQGTARSGTARQGHTMMMEQWQERSTENVACMQ